VLGPGWPGLGSSSPSPGRSPVDPPRTRAFARRDVDKTYLALVKGHPPDRGRIEQPLMLLDTPSHVMMGPAGDAPG